MNELYDGDLHDLRKLASRGLIPFLWLHVLAALGMAMALDIGWMMPVVATASLSAAATLFWAVGDTGQATRLVVGVAVVGCVATLLAEMAGHPWQSDIHMYFFVALAVLAVYCDPAVIVLSAAAIALHHVVLNVLFPAAIYPGGGDATRVVLHIVVVAMEAGVLVWLTHELVVLFRRSAEKEAEIQSGRAETYRRDAVLAERNKMSALGQLAGGVAHELNNLLQPALTLPELVRDNLPEDDLESREDLNLVLESVRQARDIVRNILIFSRKQDSTMETVDLSVEMAQSLKFVRELLPMGITLFPHITGSGMMATVDRNQLTQALTNLVTNAATAVGDRGLIEVSLGRATPSTDEADRLGLDAAASYVTVAVTDNGTGMDEATKARVFEPFFTTKPVGEGAGLGLSVVFGIMRSLGGAVAVESTVGKGSVFTLYLPAAEELSGHPSAHSPGHAPGHPAGRSATRVAA